MWAQLANSLLGIWLMAAPAVLGYGDPARMNDRIVGPIAASFAFIAVWEVTRGLRRFNVALGAWLVVAPWMLGYDTVATVNSTAVGPFLIFFAALGGTVGQRFGGGWASLVPGSEVSGEA